MVLGLNDERKKSKERDRSPLKPYNNSPDITKTGDKKNKSITRTNSPSITANTNAILVTP